MDLFKKYRKYLIALVVIFLVLGFIQVPWNSSVDEFIVGYLKISDEKIPRTTEGRIDLIEFTDQQFRVPTNQNVLAGIISVLGVDEYTDDDEKNQIFLELGIETPDVVIEDVDDYLPEEEETSDGVYFGQNPWTEKDYPEAHQWLEKNTSLIDKLVEAANRPKFYHPTIRHKKDDLLFEVLFGGFSEMRDAARILCHRAKYFVGVGDIDAAINDLVAIHELGVKTECCDTLIHRLVGIAIVGLAFDVFQDIVSNEQLTIEQVEKLENDYFRQAPTSLVGPIEKIEFYGLLDSIQNLERGVDRNFLGIGEENIFGPSVTINDFQAAVLFSRYTHWQSTASQVFVWKQRVEEICKIENDRRRLIELDSLGIELEELNQSLGDFGTNLQVFAGARSRGFLVGDLLAAMSYSNVQTVDVANVKQKIQRDLKTVGLAIEKYRLEKNAYPAKLANLMPDYIDQLPFDRFSERQLSYRLTDDKYFVASDGRDEVSQLESYFDGAPTGARYDNDDVVLQVLRK